MNSRLSNNQELSSLASEYSVNSCVGDWGIHVMEMIFKEFVAGNLPPGQFYQVLIDLASQRYLEYPGKLFRQAHPHTCSKDS